MVYASTLSTTAKGEQVDKMLIIGKRYFWGKLVAIGWVGERYYWFLQNGVAVMLPADVVEV